MTPASRDSTNSSIAHRLHAATTFFKAFMAAPNVVGAALPSSRALASALIAPIRARKQPVRILEVGAGTGAVTRELLKEVGPNDHLAICEIRQDLLALLERTVLNNEKADRLRSQNQLVLHNCPVQELDCEDAFDFVVSGLPFTAFSPEQVRDILSHIDRLLKSGGVLSYFEYIALRKIRRWIAFGAKRKKLVQLSDLLDANIRSRQFRRRTVLINFPPAHARLLRFG